MYLSIVTDRTLIIPNVLGDDGLTGIDIYKSLIMWPGFRIAHIRQKKKRSEGSTGTLQESEEDDRVLNNRYRNFFVSEKNLLEEISREDEKNGNVDISSLVSIVEPAYYWRIRRDYSTDIPRPTVLSFLKSATLPDIERYLLSPDVRDIPRIVIHMDTKKGKKKNNNEEENTKEFDFLSENVHNLTINRLMAWAEDSVGSYRKFSQEFPDYVTIPKLHFEANRIKEKNLLRNVIIHDIRPCDRILREMRGNRSCFDKCQ